MRKRWLGAIASIGLAFSALAAIELVYFPGRSLESHERALRAKAVAITELTAYSIAPALDFDDLDVIDEFLSNAARDEDLAYIGVTNAEGKLVGSRRDPGVDMPATVAVRPMSAPSTELRGGMMHVVQPVVAASGRRTMLIAGFSTQRMLQAQRASRDAAIAISIAILLLGVVVGVWNGRVLSRLERLAAENEVARARAEAASSAKSQFLANMSHEIRTPMNGVLGVTQLLAATRLDEHQARLLETAQRSGQHLLALINEILDLAKVEAGGVTLENFRFELRPLLQEVVEAEAVMAREKSIWLRAHVQDDVPAWVSGDRVRLRQVIGNLVANAVKFTQTGGVTVELKIEREADAQDVVWLRGEVVDTGIGIAPEQAGRLFRAFEQGDSSITRRYGGTGLGLAISKGLVESMGGAVGVDSVAGQGSRFWFTVPLAVSRTPVPERVVPSQPASLATTALRILAAEDNEVNRMIVQEMARQLGHQLVTADNGRSALEELERSGPYDVVLMDCQMPILDGYAAAREIRVREAERGAPRMPILALTASALPGERERVLAAGMDDLLTKPVSLSELRRRLEEIAGPRVASS